MCDTGSMKKPTKKSVPNLINDSKHTLHLNYVWVGADGTTQAAGTLEAKPGKEFNLMFTKIKSNK